MKFLIHTRKQDLAVQSGIVKLNGTKIATYEKSRVYPYYYNLHFIPPIATALNKPCNIRTFTTTQLREDLKDMIIFNPHPFASYIR